MDLAEHTARVRFLRRGISEIFSGAMLRRKKNLAIQIFLKNEKYSSRIAFR